MACSSGSLCDACHLHPAVAYIHWREWAGKYCEKCGAKLMTEAQHPPTRMVAIEEPHSNS